MTIELHPEEVLDRAVSGNMTELDRHVLERHLAECRACHLHLALRQTSATTLGAHPWDNHANRLVVDRVMARIESRGPRLFAFRPRAPLLIAAALVVLAGVASAAWHRSVRNQGAPQAVTHSVIQTGTTARATPQVAASEPEPSVPALDSLPFAPPAPTALTGEADASTDATPPPTAAALFERASILRSNRPIQAIAVFRRLQQLFPKSRESQLSFALVGGLLLENGQDADAVAQFDRYLMQGGAASEEALAGRAAALERLGRSDAEADTWQRLLKSYPKSVYASEARTRLVQIARASASAR